MVMYDSKLESFKYPFGAVRAGTKLTFNIYISKEIFPESVSFIYRNDEKNESLYSYMQKTGEYDCFNIFSCVVNFTETGLFFYRFEFIEDNKIYYVGLKNGETQIGEWLDEWQLTVYDKSFKTPDWAKGAIMYQIFPDRFKKSTDFIPQDAKNERKIHKDWNELPDSVKTNEKYLANDFFMGNLKGIAEMLDYLKQLGVSIIYLNPVFESAEYHRYSTADYLKIDPFLGTNDDFEELCNLAQRNGIRIILDGVFSHTGADSLYFNKYSHYASIGAYNSRNSPFYSWYNFTDYPEKYESWWGFENLPNVNETNPEFLDFITGENGVLRYWLKLGASGWRLDVADELPDAFLDFLRKSVKSEKEDSLIIGEVWEDATNKFAYGKRRRYLLGAELDSVMNYPWRTAVLNFVNDKDALKFSKRIMTIAENYPEDALNVVMNSISTHDTLRAITFFGVTHEVREENTAEYKMTPDEYAQGKQKLLLATFLQFTLPGIACIYYGDEVGLDGFRDPFSRKTYPYGREDFEILDFYKKLALVRTKCRDDFVKPIKIITAKDGFCAFSRGKLLCAINLGTQVKTIDSENKKIIFAHKNVYEKDDKICLEPNSAVILAT
ncbi:MAG: glycoside hydrolase family 13 protein [Clostridia bacterium]|nr:glycoside hydrolase family 13 protein [Clostridia bacterium]